jgi:PPOX class probable F420-dependent enzyme
MQRALHPAQAKRIQTTDSSGELVVADIGACELIDRPPMPHTMTPDAVRAFLSHGTRTAKVATSGPDGQPHVMPVWFVLDGEDLVFTTGGDSVKGRNLSRDPRAAVVVDEEVAPYAFVHIRGHVTLSEDLEELLRFATAIGGRYMGAGRAEEFGRRNAVPGELLVRLRPKRVIAAADVAG